ncbi:ferritin-like domain-containing protein [Lacibacter sp. H375]|uniref:YciE/YciF ferroxidase family protein n=1 Tax=Lacibacter sp. H375 TaxID=3133424 RepID=UPI0030BB2C0B
MQKKTDSDKNKKAVANGKTPNKGMQSSQLMKLFENELKDIFWAEKALTAAIPKMIKKATSDELVAALEKHLEETHEQIKLVEEVFKSINMKPVGKKCEAMAGLMKEAEAIIDECEPGAMCDAGIIAGAQKIEHYEIASYGTMRQFAETLALPEAAKLLEQILEQEKEADVKLTEVAVSAVNVEAAELEDVDAK